MELSSSTKEFVAGTLGGFAAKALDYPLDTVKVLLQTQEHGNGSSTGVVYRNAWQCFRHTLETRGITGLYKGISSPLLGSMAENALLFWAYDHTKQLVADLSTTTTTTTVLSNDSPQQDQQQLSLWQLALAGAGAGALVPLVLTPFELVKCRLQVQNNAGAFQATYKGPVDVVWQVVRKEGVFGLYRGNTSTLLREVPGNFVWYGCYEGTCLAMIPPGGTKADLGTGVHLLGGAMAGVGYWTACYPLDTVKSLVQTRGGGVWGTAIHLWQTQGIRGFFAGWGVTVMRAAPAHALIFAVYEQTLSILNRQDGYDNRQLASTANTGGKDQKEKDAAMVISRRASFRD